MRNTRQNKIMLYLTLASLLLMPLRVIADVAGDTPENHDRMPCHSSTNADQADITPKLIDDITQQDCCGENDMLHHCADCYSSTLLYFSHPYVKFTVAYHKPSPYIYRLKPNVPNNLYRPPRSVI